MSLTATELRISGYTIQQLKQNQYTDTEILYAGYSADELRIASYTAIQLKNAGYSNKEIVQGKYNNFQLKKAGIKTAYELRKMGYSAYQIMNEGYSGQILKTLKFTPTELLDPEVLPSEMRKYGYSIADMKRAGIRVAQLLESGFELKRIITAGFGLDEILIGTVTIEDIKKIKVPTIKTLYTPIQLLNAGLDVTYLRRIGFTADELRQAGITAKQLRLGGYDPIQVYNAGYSLSEMKDAGHFAYEVANFGYTFSDLVNAGYSGDELKSAGYLNFTNIVVLGYTSISGLVNFMATNNSTSYSNGAVIIAGGLGVSKDMYLNELYTKLQIKIDISGQIIHDGNNLKLIHLIESCIVRFTLKENGQISLIVKENDAGNIDINNNFQVNYNKVNIPTELTCVGGISTQNNVYAKNYISVDASDSEIMRVSSSLNGIVTTSKTGVTYSNDSLNIGKNNNYFGSRTLSEPSANLQIGGSTGSIAFSFQKQQANSEITTTDLTISSNGTMNIINDTQSTSTSSGPLQTNGGMGIEKNLNVAGAIEVWDTLNSGTIQQTQTTIEFSSGDSSTPMPSQTTSLFSTVSSSTEGATMSISDLHTHVYNNANPLSQKTVLAETFSIISGHLQVTNVVMTVGYPLFSAIYLQKDQVIKGVIHNCTTTGGKTNYYYAAIYGKGYQPMRLAYTGNTPFTLSQGFNYVPFETSWTVPTTDIYYIAQLTTGTSGTSLAISANTYLNYSTPALSGGGSYASLATLTSIMACISVYAPNTNKIYCFPNLNFTSATDVTTIQVFDVSTNSLTTSITDTTGGGLYRYCVYCPDNNCIYSIQMGTTVAKVSILNTTNNTMTSITNIPCNGNLAWEQGYYVSHNKSIYFIPRLDSKVLVINTTNNTYSTPITGLPGNSNWIGGALAPNNKIYCAPFANRTQILVINTLNNTISYITTSTGSSSAYVYAVASPNGKVFCFQWSQSTGMLVINSNNDTASIVSTLNLGTTYTVSGAISQVDGKLYCFPYNGSNRSIRIVDTNNNTFTSSSFTTSTPYWTTMIATNNTIYATSSTQTNVPLLAIPFNPNPDDGKIVKTIQYHGSGTTALLPSQITSTPNSTASNLLLYCGVYG